MSVAFFIWQGPWGTDWNWLKLIEIGWKWLKKAENRSNFLTQMWVNFCCRIFRLIGDCTRSAANGGLRDGGLRKSEDIWGKRPFSSVFWIFQVLFRPSGKGRKRQKKGEKADFGRFPGRAARHPLNPHLLHPHLRQPNVQFCFFLGGGEGKRAKKKTWGKAHDL